MSLEQTDATKGLVARVKNILLKPAQEWEVIDGEPATIQGLYTGYIAPLAAIPYFAAAIGLSLIGVSAFGVSVKTPLVASLVGAVVNWIIALGGVAAMALIIEALAPTFGAEKNRIQAFKVAAYSGTAGYVAGILMILPGLILLAGLLSLYSLYLLWIGLPKLMKAPQDKAVGYVVVSILATFAVLLVINFVGRTVANALSFGTSSVFANQSVGGKVKVGDSEIDLGALEAQAKQAEAAAKQMQAQLEGKTVEGAVSAVPADTLKALLPASVAGFNRTSVESSSGGVGGIQGSNAQGEYTKGDATFTLNVTDMAAAGGLAGMAGAFNVSSNRETATGYEKMGKVDGRMTTENYDRSSRTGEYSVLVANRFMVQAQGSNVSMDELKAAVGAVGLGRLDGLAKG